MNMAEYTRSWQSAAGAAEECQYLNQLLRELKNLFDVWMNLVDQVGKEQQSGRKAKSPPSRKKE